MYYQVLCFDVWCCVTIISQRVVWDYYASKSCLSSSVKVEIFTLVCLYVRLCVCVYVCLCACISIRSDDKNNSAQYEAKKVLDLNLCFLLA